MIIFFRNVTIKFKINSFLWEKVEKEEEIPNSMPMNMIFIN